MSDNDSSKTQGWGSLVLMTTVMNPHTPVESRELESSSPDQAAKAPIIERGICHCMFVYDIGSAIDLETAAKLAAETAHRETSRHGRTAPRYFDFQPPPVRIRESGPAFQVGGCATAPAVDCVLYDFGAVSVIYEIDIAGTLINLATLSEALYDNQQLLSDSRQRVAALLARIRPAVRKGSIATVVEDYVIYQIESLLPATKGGAFARTHAPQIAQILRSERKRLSEQEIEDALSCRISYSTDDIAIIDWQATLMLGREMEDVQAVLEFANVELLELRFLDDRLDKLLDRFYKALSRRRWRPWYRLHGGSSELRRLAKLQMEASVLFEEVNNALKLFGDQFLARVYRLSAQRLHLPDWDTSVLRKLQTIESMYGKLTDYQNSRRMEMLEWIIIVLIAISIALALLPGFRH